MTPQPGNLSHEVSVFPVMEIRSSRADKQCKNKEHNFSFKEKKPALLRRESMGEISLPMIRLVLHKPPASHRAGTSEVSRSLFCTNFNHSDHRRAHAGPLLSLTDNNNNNNEKPCLENYCCYIQYTFVW